MTQGSVRTLSRVSFFSLLVYILFQYIAQDEFMPHVVHSVIMYVFIFISFIYAGISKKGISSFSIWYGLFLVYCCISYLFAEYTDSYTLYQVFVCWVIGYCVLINTDSIPKLIYVAKAYSFSSVILGLMIFIKKGIVGIMAMGNASGSERLGQELMGNANIFTAVYMYAAIFTIWLLVCTGNKKEKLLYFIILLFQLFLMSLSGGRKTIIIVFICFFLSQYLKNGSGISAKNIKTIVTTGILLVAVYFAVMNVDFLYNIIGSRFESMFEFFVEGKRGNQSEYARMQMIQLGLDYWTENPLFGHGLDSFKYFNMYMGGGFKYSHNNYVELLYDFGLIGFVLYYSIYVYILKRTLRHKRTFVSILVYMILIELLVFDFGGISYYTNGSIILLAIAFSASRLTVSQQYKLN